ncbi:unnamed protein product [Acanthosepion pharaonis]|uniref:Uncharacterized protein n=1 Tax=Acanthosepion pharaonis TaxID=158019 RepID=A0A812EA62_ACAPH|nr:unnamed protein product [Sepia pharaonis]
MLFFLIHSFSNHSLLFPNFTNSFDVHFSLLPFFLSFSPLSQLAPHFSFSFQPSFSFLLSLLILFLFNVFFFIFVVLTIEFLFNLSLLLHFHLLSLFPPVFFIYSALSFSLNSIFIFSSPSHSFFFLNSYFLFPFFFSFFSLSSITLHLLFTLLSLTHINFSFLS